MAVPASSSKWAHPPRWNRPRSSSSGPPGPCITPSTETCVVVVSFMVAVPFSLVVVRVHRTGAPIFIPAAESGRPIIPHPPRTSALSYSSLSAAEQRPTDVVPQPLVVEYELANRLRELVALPVALESPGALALSFRRGSTCGLDRIGSRTELVRGDVCDDRRLAGSKRGMARCPTQISGRGHCVATRCASLGHRDLAAHPRAGLLNRLTRSRVFRPSRLEPVEDVLRARCRPQGEELVIGIGEGPTAADRHETRRAIFREDHTRHPFCSPNGLHDAPAP